MISKESFTGKDRGVSPVIGVILMVAVTVVLAAVIGASVLDVGNDVGESPSASLDYDGEDTLTVISAQNVDSIEANGVELEDPEAGETLDLREGDDLDEGDTFTVVGEVNGDSQVLQTFEFTGEEITG